MLKNEYLSLIKTCTLHPCLPLEYIEYVENISIPIINEIKL